MASLTHHPKGTLDSAFATPLVHVLHRTCFLIDGVIASLYMLHYDGWLVFGKCKRRNSWAMADTYIPTSK
jgi:hypothetical protein